MPLKNGDQVAIPGSSSNSMVCVSNMSQMWSIFDDSSSSSSSCLQAGSKLFYDLLRPEDRLSMVSFPHLTLEPLTNSSQRLSGWKVRMLNGFDTL